MVSWISAIATATSFLLGTATAFAQSTPAVPIGRSAIAQAPPAAPICPAQLPANINRVLNRLSSTRWGILVQPLEVPARRTTLYARNPDALLTPASTLKLLTTAAALQRLGASYRIRTPVTGNSREPFLSTLRIIGQGDPSLTTANLNQLGQRLAQQGIRQVNLLIGDDTHFQGAMLNPGWDADDILQGYGAPVNSLMLNQNAIGVTLVPQRTGQPLRVQWDDPTDAQTFRLNNRSVTVARGRSEFVEVSRDPNNDFLIQVEGQLQEGSASEPAAAAIANPGNYLIGKFRNILTANQIQVTQATVVRKTPAPTGEVVLTTWESPPLTELIKETNQNSNNIYAEVLLRTLGVVQTPGNRDATASGIAAVRSILSPLGVSPNGYRMADGSGLADPNLASATSLVQTLQAIAQTPNAAVYRDSLAVAGVNGTLKNRFRGTAAQGRLQGKTGTVDGATTLAGYLTPPNYPPLAFSILANDTQVSAARLRAAIDEVILLLTRLRSC